MDKSVSNKLIRWKVDQLASSGIDMHSMLAACEISDYEINEDDGRISDKLHYRLMLQTYPYTNTLLQKTSTQFLQQTFPEFFGLCLNAPSAAEAANTFLKYRFVIGNSDHCRIYLKESSLRLEYENLGPAVLNNHSALGNFTLLKNILANYLPDMRVQIFLVGHEHSGYRNSENTTDCPCYFGQSSNYMLITSQHLYAPFAAYNQPLRQLQLSCLEKDFPQRFQYRNFSDTVAELISRELANESVDNASNLMQLVSKKLHMSRWTLNNRLKNYNLTFSDILVRSRINKAKQLLSQSEYSIQRISEEVHFGSQASFSRFFKHHTNVSPKEFRKNNQQYQSRN